MPNFPLRFYNPKRQVSSLLEFYVARHEAEIRQAQKKDIGLERAGLPIEVGRVAGFLASGFSSYVTGANIVVDGGASVMNPLTVPIQQGLPYIHGYIAMKFPKHGIASSTRMIRCDPDKTSLPTRKQD